MADKRDPFLENAFADTVARLADPYAAPAAFASLGFQMMRSSIVFWAEMAQSMMRGNAASLLTPAAKPVEPARPAPASSDVGAPAPSSAPQPLGQAKPKPARLRVVASAKLPTAVTEPTDTPDDLKAISGIGPKLEKVLNGMGISNFAHLATLDSETIASIEEKLGFSGRIGRDGWILQAKALSAGAAAAGSKQA